jgi:hypothetical protein
MFLLDGNRQNLLESPVFKGFSGHCSHLMVQNSTGDSVPRGAP